MDNKTNKRVNGFFLSLVLLHLGASILVSVLGTGVVKLGTFGALMFTQLLILVPSFVFLLIFKCDLSEWIPFKKLKPGTVGLVILFSFLIMPLISLINVFSQLFTTNTAVEMSGEFIEMPVVLTVFIVGFFGPFCEEFTFRGVIFGGFKKHGYVFAAAVLSGLYFGLMHLNLNQFSYALILGVVFCMLVEATGSIWGSVTAHAVINTWNIILMLAMDKAYTGMGMDIFEMSQEMVTADMKLQAMGVLLVISVVATALAVGVYIAICKSEGRLDEVISMFCRPDGAMRHEDADEGFKDNVSETDDEKEESSGTYSVKPVGRLITASGYIAIAVCLFVIFLLDKAVMLVQKYYR